MQDDFNELLRTWGENTAYSFKTHYKSADLMRLYVLGCILIPFTFSVIGLANPLPGDHWAMKVLNIASVIGSVLLLVHESVDGKNARQLHVKFGERYLELHNEIYKEFTCKNTSQAKIDEIQTKLNEINKDPEKPSIVLFAKLLADYAVEQKQEMRIWWRNQP